MYTENFDPKSTISKVYKIKSRFLFLKDLKDDTKIWKANLDPKHHIHFQLHIKQISLQPKHRLVKKAFFNSYVQTHSPPPPDFSFIIRNFTWTFFTNLSVFSDTPCTCTDTKLTQKFSHFKFFFFSYVVIKLLLQDCMRNMCEADHQSVPCETVEARYSAVCRIMLRRNAIDWLPILVHSNLIFIQSVIQQYTVFGTFSIALCALKFVNPIRVK